jgi:DNA-binding beta-propeller fold protein YncE
MFRSHSKSPGWFMAAVALAVAVALQFASPLPAYAQKKDKKKAVVDDKAPRKTFLDTLDYSKIVWPNPPAITRVRYLNYFSGEKYKGDQKQEKKSTWMDRLAGVTVGNTNPAEKLRFQLIMPYGMAVDSKNRLYIADRKVSAIFIVNTDTWEFEMIKNGINARFGTIIGVAIDDADRLFVSDSTNRRVLVFGPDHKVESSISQGLADPGGLAIDNENRFLYVADAGLDQVLVYDADPPYKLLRRIGTGGKNHTLTTPGDFAVPTNLAVDGDGNLYVADTLNDRVEIFDPDGNFIRTFGKAGDGPGYFARPKGIAVDSDGHVWVADGVQDRVQVFTAEGQLLMYMGEHGLLPGQFNTVAGLTIDKNNRVFTSEQYPGRVQMFQYTTDEEARAEKARREAEEQQKKPAGKTANTTAPGAEPGAGKTPEAVSPVPKKP